MDAGLSVTEPQMSALPGQQWVFSEEDSGTCPSGSSRRLGFGGGYSAIRRSLNHHSEEMVLRRGWCRGHTRQAEDTTAETGTKIR